MTRSRFMGLLYPGGEALTSRDREGARGGNPVNGQRNRLLTCAARWGVMRW